mgnify:CR=1 FL=1
MWWSAMNEDSWTINLKFALAEIKLWKRKFIQKQLQKNPDLTRLELSKKIKSAKAGKFKNKFDFLIFEHPNYPYSK